MEISIHSLRMEGDNPDGHYNPTHGISIHSLRMEGDPCWYTSTEFCSLFQSTPSAWRETRWWNRNCPVSVISIHSLRMEGDPPAFVVFKEEKHISIHSLRMEGDYKCAIIYTEVRDFNPLPPHGGRLRWVAAPGRFGNISIHSLRMEGDSRTEFVDVFTLEFQSTPSAWRETIGSSSSR